MSKKIVVTGGAGYIGSHTVVALAQAGYTPIIIDDFRNSQPWIINRLTQLIGKDILGHAIDCTDENELISIFNLYKDIQGVIHFAAYKAVGESTAEPVKYYQNNVGSLCAVLSAMQKCNIKTIVFSSSCTVYGEPNTPSVIETTAIQNAKSPYGDTKIVCERILNYTAYSSSPVSSVLLRYFNPIGAHESALIGELPIGVPNNLVPFITQTAAGIRKELTVYGNDYNTPDGTNIRDYIHVVDLAEAHVKAMQWLEKQNEIVCEPFNVGTGKGSSVLEIIRSFEKATGEKLNYKIGDRRPGDVVQIFADPSKAENVLNWKTKLSIEQALKDAWEWQKTLK